MGSSTGRAKARVRGNITPATISKISRFIVYFRPLVRNPATSALNSATDPSSFLGASQSPKEYVNVLRMNIRDSDNAPILAIQIVNPEIPRSFIVELPHKETSEELSDAPICSMVGALPILNCRENTIRPAMKDSTKKAAVNSWRPASNL